MLTFSKFLITIKIVPQHRLPILTYHNVDLPPTGVKYPRLYVRPTAFAAQMRLLRRLGFQGVSLTEGLSRLRAGCAQRSVVLTFDDGYADNLSYAAPVLRQYGFGATCFIVSGCVGSYNRWDAELLGVHKPTMSRGGLRSWLDAGFEIGSHTHSHPRLSQLAPEQAFEEIASSRERLQALTGTQVHHFCYPYGDCNPQLADQVRRAGYTAAVSGARGRALPHGDPYRLPRISISGGKTLFKYLLKVATPYEDIAARGHRQ